MSETLAGRAVFVAEDEYFLAIDLARELRQLGADVVGPVATVDAAMQLLDTEARIDAAILDVNLGGELVFCVADRLRARGIPFMFATGYDRDAIPPRFVDVALCAKPVRNDKLTEIWTHRLLGR